MKLVFYVTGWHDEDEICSVNYGIGRATLSKAKYVYDGPDDAPLDSITGTSVNEIEKELFRMGFKKLETKK
jgi:hypothetical protein